jgi:hypothetical protein
MALEVYPVGPDSTASTVGVRVFVIIFLYLIPHFQIPVPKVAICSSPIFDSILKSQSSSRAENNDVFASIVF